LSPSTSLSLTFDPVHLRFPRLAVSHKAQEVRIEYEGTVHELLHDRIRGALAEGHFVSDVMRPLAIEELMENEGR
jgi:translation initiation factor RLI1